MTATLLNRDPHSVSEISAEIFALRRSYFDLVQKGQQFENFFKQGVDSLQIEKKFLDLEAQHNISVTTTAVIDVCYEHGLSSLEQLKKALRSP